MIAVEKLSIKLQELFGGNYFIVPFYVINRDYTITERTTDNFGNVQYIQSYNDKLTEIRKNKIVASVNLQNPTRANTDVYYVTSSFTIDFSVPTNNRKYSDGVLEPLHFDFFGDYERVCGQVINKTLEYGELKGKMVISEPIYVGVERDGENTYCVYRVTGTFSLTDKATFGEDYKVKILIDGEFVELDGINSFNENLDNGTNAIVKQDKIKTELNLSQLGWVCSVGIDDIETENLARQKLYEIIHLNEEIINEDAEEKKKRKLRVRIETPQGNHDFYAVVGITFNTNSNSVGSYQISFADDNKGLAIYTLSFDSQGGESVPDRIITEYDNIGDLPTLSKQSYLFSHCEIDGEKITKDTMYKYNEDKTAVAIWKQDLTDTTWEFNNILTRPALTEIDYSIDFNTSEKSYDLLKFEDYGEMLYEWEMNYNTDKAYRNQSTGGFWVKHNVNKRITITGGIDVTNVNLINWLKENATQKE